MLKKLITYNKTMKGGTNIFDFLFTKDKTKLETNIEKFMDCGNNEITWEKKLKECWFETNYEQLVWEFKNLVEDIKTILEDLENIQYAIYMNFSEMYKILNVEDRFTLWDSNKIDKIIENYDKIKVKLENNNLNNDNLKKSTENL